LVTLVYLLHKLSCAHRHIAIDSDDFPEVSGRGPILLYCLTAAAVAATAALPRGTCGRGGRGSLSCSAS